MADINTDSMAIAPGVIDTIVALAVREVPGVASVGSSDSGLKGLFSKKKNSGVEVISSDSSSVGLAITIQVYNNFSLPDLASQIRSAVADAVLSQVGISVTRVDIRVDGIIFQD